METLDPQILGQLTNVGGVGVAMLWPGTRLHVLERRQTDRRCPSCRRIVARGRVCPRALAAGSRGPRKPGPYLAAAFCFKARSTAPAARATS